MCRLIQLIAIIIGIFSVFPVNGLADSKVPVFVSIMPQKYFVQQIGQDWVDVRVMVRPGANPATYEPKPRQMADLTKAKIYFAIGVPYEKVWLDKIAAANPKMKIVHTDHGIDKMAMAAHDHADVEDTHHEDAAHEKDSDPHSGLDPHVWLSPPLVKIQARAILAALQQMDPEHGHIYAANFQELTARIDQLDADLKETFADKTGLQFMVFHPSWGYFAHAYGLKQVPIEIEGKNPKPAQLKALIQHARESGVKVIFVQPQFSTKSAKVVAREIGGQVVFADPLAEDWMANLREVAGKLQSALK